MVPQYKAKAAGAADRHQARSDPDIASWNGAAACYRAPHECWTPCRGLPKDNWPARDSRPQGSQCVIPAVSQASPELAVVVSICTLGLLSPTFRPVAPTSGWKGGRCQLTASPGVCKAASAFRHHLIPPYTFGGNHRHQRGRKALMEQVRSLGVAFSDKMWEDHLSAAQLVFLGSLALVVNGILTGIWRDT